MRLLLFVSESQLRRTLTLPPNSYAIYEYERLIDSSEIEPQDFLAIAADIERKFVASSSSPIPFHNLTSQSLLVSQLLSLGLVHYLARHRHNGFLGVGAFFSARGPRVRLVKSPFFYSLTTS